MNNKVNRVVVLSAVRTPVGKYGGSFKDTSAVTLGTIAAVEAIKRAGITPDKVDEVIFGQARQAGNRPNPARQILFKTGIPIEKTGFTVNKACASGIKAITLGCHSLLMGENKIVLVGGIENMSQIPYFLDGARWGYRLGDGVLVDGMYRDGLFCPLADMIMGETAEILADKYQISRSIVRNMIANVAFSIAFIDVYQFDFGMIMPYRNTIGALITEAFEADGAPKRRLYFFECGLG